MMSMYALSTVRNLVYDENDISTSKTQKFQLLNCIYFSDIH